MELLEFINGAVLRDVDLSAAKEKDFLNSTGTFANGITLIFDIGSLTVENPFTLKCDSGVYVEPSSIIGCCITATYETHDEFVLVFDGRISLSISLREEDFTGSKAAVFRSASDGLFLFK